MTWQTIEMKSGEKAEFPQDLLFKNCFVTSPTSVVLRRAYQVTEKGDGEYYYYIETVNDNVVHVKTYNLSANEIKYWKDQLNKVYKIYRKNKKEQLEVKRGKLTGLAIL